MSHLGLFASTARHVMLRLPVAALESAPSSHDNAAIHTPIRVLRSSQGLATLSSRWLRLWRAQTLFLATWLAAVQHVIRQAPLTLLTLRIPFDCAQPRKNFHDVPDSRLGGLQRLSSRQTCSTAPQQLPRKIGGGCQKHGTLPSVLPLLDPSPGLVCICSAGPGQSPWQRAHDWTDGISLQDEGAGEGLSQWVVRRIVAWPIFPAPALDFAMGCQQGPSLSPPRRRRTQEKANPPRLASQIVMRHFGREGLLARSSSGTLLRREWSGYDPATTPSHVLSPHGGVYRGQHWASPVINALGPCC
jgi:hypothetical protein